MATVQDAMTIARNGSFQDRVRYFVTKAAIAVMAELNTVPSHVKRVTYAKAVLNQQPSTETSEAKFDVFPCSVAVMTNPSLLVEADLNSGGYGIPDNDLEFTVNSMYNAFAGVSN